MTIFYTRSGDDGTTGLLGNQRVDKDDLRIEVIGNLDELSAAIGLARSINEEPVKSDLADVQRTLYEIMSEIAALPDHGLRFEKLNNQSLSLLEDRIAEYSSKTELPDGFILPGDTPQSAACSMARTIARRAERRLVTLQKQNYPVRKILVQFLNRLSSLFYILEIYTAQLDHDKGISLAKKKES